MRRLPDRMLHRRRHLEACRRVARLRPVRSILVVCYGNVCRSPYLEAVLRELLPGVRVSSAGFVGPDRPVPRESLLLAAKRGIDLSSFRSSPVARAKANHSDLVVVMDAEQARQMSRVFQVSPARIVIAGDLDRIAGTTRAIRDPWGQSVEVFASSFDRLERCAASLVRLLRGN